MEESRSSGSHEFVSPPPVACFEDVDNIDRDTCLTYIAYLRFGMRGLLAGDDDFLRGGGGDSASVHELVETDGRDTGDSSGSKAESVKDGEGRPGGFEGGDFKPTGCPNGHISSIVRNGLGRRGEQRYLCRECETTFTPLSGTIFEGRKLSLPEMVFLISHMDEMDALSLAEEVPRSYRSVRSFLKAVRGAEDSLIVRAFRSNGRSSESDGTSGQS